MNQEQEGNPPQEVRATEKRKPRGILWRVLFVVLALIFFAVLELGKHTITGWIFAVIILVLFYIFRSAKLKDAKRGIRFLTWICLLVLCGVILWVSWPPVKAIPAVKGKSAGTTEIVHVKQGDLSGVLTEDGSVEVYAGIPFAQPPVGELRWKEPEPAQPWEGVLAADHFAPMSMQKQNLPIYDSLTRIIGYHDYKISFTDNYREPVSEDSLYLNVWKPAGSEEEKLPVLVFVHGGSLQTGNTWYEEHSGEGLARKGAVVVEMAYRLGVFGFYADPELASESPNGTTGNYGLLDQILALEWVRDNIASFGGDPDNVTLAGESAGSVCVSALCTSPLAKGLFRRVLAESSTVSAPEPAHSFRPLEEAFEAAEETKQKYGAASSSELRAVPAEKIVDEVAIHHHVTIDGYVLEETPCESYAKGLHNEEAQMQGFNRDESAPFIIFDQANMKNYEKKIRDYFEPTYADQILALYPASTDEEARKNWADIYSVVLFSYGHYCLARQAQENGIPSYMYYFTKDNRALGPWHSGEMIYFYGMIPPASSLFQPDDYALSEEIQTYILNYMKTGDPNGEGMVPWKITPDGKRVLEFGTETKEIETPHMALFDILDEMYGFEQ